MTGIARIFNNSFRSLLIRNNIALASSSIYSRNPYNVPNFLKSNSTIYCVTSVDYHSKKGRYRTDQHWLDEWEQENRYDHDVVIDTEVFEDEGRSRFYLMLKCTGILCFIFFLNLADIIRIQLRNSAPKSEEGEKGWRDSVYWKNKGFTGFMSLSIVFGNYCISISFNNFGFRFHYSGLAVYIYVHNFLSSVCFYSYVFLRHKLCLFHV